MDNKGYDIFKDISRMKLPLDKLGEEKGQKEFQNKVDQVESLLDKIGEEWSKMVDKDQKEFRKWAREHVEEIETMYRDSNMRNLIIDYLSHMAMEVPDMPSPHVGMNIAFGAFVYGYYAAKVKGL